jgi:hypothetical protein
MTTKKVSEYSVRFQVLTAASMMFRVVYGSISQKKTLNERVVSLKTIAFWDIALCSLVEVY